METVITDYASYVVGGDWAYAFNQAILEIRQFHNNSVPPTGTEGGTIKIPKGRYTIKSPVSLYNGMVFSGEGMGSLLVMENTGVFKKNTDPGNIKYVTFEKLYFMRGTTFNFSTAKCFIDFTLSYLCKIDSCIAVGSGTTGTNIIFTILGDTVAPGDFSHYNTLSNCDVMDFNYPFMINYNRQMGVYPTSEMSNDHRILSNRFRNFLIPLAPINLYSGHNKFCFNGVETESLTPSSDWIMLVPGTANAIISNRLEKHGTRIIYGAKASGADNVFFGNRYTGVGISRVPVQGGSVTMPGTNNILLEPGSSDDPAGPIPAYFHQFLALGQNGDFNLNFPTGGISVHQPEAWSGTLQPVKRIKAYNDSGTFIGYIPIFN
jgi:hypothetical protein